MNRLVKSGEKHGEVNIPSSKSYAHRLMICSFFAETETKIYLNGISKDIEATAKCLSALGREIKTEDGCIYIGNKKDTEPTAKLFCGESGSTLRFLLPVVGALGVDAVFYMEGKLKDRPMAAFTDVLSENGMIIKKEDDLLYCSGKLRPGKYSIPGNISSQYVSGLLFALPLLEGDSVLEVTGDIESADYIVMTEDSVKDSGIEFIKEDNIYKIPGGQKYISRAEKTVEPDWSNAAFFLCMGALSGDGVTVNGMDVDSKQGDKEILNILKAFGAKLDINGKKITVKRGELKGITVDASAIPDLVPTISALASGAEGVTVIKNASRLRFKESDRIKTTKDMLLAVGADVKETEDGLIIKGSKKLKGGSVDAANDHRIAMSAAVVSSICEKDVEVVGAECVKKSYPDFWSDLSLLEVK